MSLFFDRFCELCEENHVTPNAVAKKLSISSGSVTAWKKNGTIPRAKTVQALADYFHVSLDYLIGNVNEPFFVLDNSKILSGINEAPNFDNPCFPSDATPYNPTHRIPILGRISAGLPLYAEENIEGWTFTDLNHGGEYFGLRVVGDSMTAARINDGDLLIIRRQDVVNDGEIAVVLVGDDEATVKRFYQDGDIVTLMPQSYNPEHKPQVYDLKSTSVRVLGKLVQNQISY